MITSLSIQNLFYFLLLTVIFGYNYIFIKTLIVIFLLFFIKILFKNLIKINTLDLNSVDSFVDNLKIKNPFINWFFIFIYVLFFIILVFCLRIYRIGFKLDVNPLKDLIILLWINKDFFLLLVFFLTTIIFLLIFGNFFKKIKKFFHHKFLRQHLVSIQLKQDVSLFRHPNPHLCSPRFVGRPDQDCLEEKQILKETQSFYIKIFRMGYYISALKISALSGDFRSWLYRFTQETNMEWMSELLRYLLKFLHTIANPAYNFFIIPFIILYDLYFNNFVLYHVFYILPFFFIYVLWYNLSEFLYQTRLASLERVIYEMIYEFPKVTYVDLTEEQLLTIGNYIVNNLRVPLEATTNDRWITWDILHDCRYVLIDKEKNIYYNPDTRDYKRITFNR